MTIALGRLAAPAKERLVVSGDEALARAIRIHELVGCKVRLKKTPGAFAFQLARLLRQRADVTPYVAVRERAAARKQGVPRRCGILIAPGGQFRPRRVP